jgi:hypothetical protein
MRERPPARRRRGAHAEACTTDLMWIKQAPRDERYGVVDRARVRRAIGEGVRTMRSAVVLALVAVLAPRFATAHVVRHSSIPEAYTGTWTPVGTCGSTDAKAIVLAAKTYTKQAATCTVDFVSETAGAQGPIFSARLLCGGAQGPGSRPSTATLIIRPDNGDRISLGAAFGSLAAYQRCADGADAKH